MFKQLEGLRSFQDLSAKFDPTMFAVALLVSLGAALLASFMYERFCQRKSTGSQINRAFPLLSIAITTLFISVQISLPLSLGLLGALSIIRFRTPVKEPEETGFIMLVIAGSITCATFNFLFLVILYAVAGVALFALNRRRGQARGDGMLMIVLADAEAALAQPGIMDCLRRNAARISMESSTSKDGLTSLQFAFTGLRLGAPELQEQLRAQAPLNTVSFFFNRPA